MTTDPAELDTNPFNPHLVSPHLTMFTYSQYYTVLRRLHAKGPVVTGYRSGRRIVRTPSIWNRVAVRLS